MPARTNNHAGTSVQQHLYIYTVGHKNVAVNFLQQFLQILTDFDNFCIKLTRNE